MTRSRKRGRPRKQYAKRNTTTRQGRRTGQDPADRGTDELRARRRRVTGDEALSHEDPLAALYGHGKLTAAQYNAGRQIGEVLAILERQGTGNVWRSIMTGTRLGYFTPEPAQVEWARRVLGRLRRWIGEEAWVVFAVCAGAWWPVVYSGVVAEGLERVARYWSRSGNNIPDSTRYYLSEQSG